MSLNERERFLETLMASVTLLKMSFLDELEVSILRWFTVVYGVFAFAGMICVYIKLPVAQFFEWSWLALAFAVVIGFLVREGAPIKGVTPPPDITFPTSSIFLGSRGALVLACMAGIIVLFERSYVFAWVLSVLAVGVVPKSHNTNYFEDRKSSAIDQLWCFAAMTIALASTVLVNRPDQDDALYVSMAQAALDYPLLPAYGPDGLFGEGFSFASFLHKPQVRELLVALLAYVSGLSVLDWYYILLPAASAVLFPLAAHALLRRLLPSCAGIAVFILVMFIIAWGDAHRAYGNFGFVRIFQGKGVFITVLVPMLVLWTINFMAQPNWRRWLVLMLSQVTAIATTSTAAFIAPVTVASVVAAFFLPNRQWLRRSAVALSTLFYPLSILVLLQIDRKTGLFRTGLGDYPPSTVMAGEWRGPLSFAMLAGLPFLAYLVGISTAPWIKKYTLSLLLLVCAPSNALILKHVASNMPWRIFWAMPLPLLLTLFTMLSYLVIRRKPDPMRLMGIIGVSLSVAFLVGGPWTIRTHLLASPGNKQDRSMYPVVNHIIVNSAQSDLILAPDQLSVIIAGLPRHPRLVNVRFHARSMFMKSHGIEEGNARMALGAFISGANAMTAGEALREVKSRKITVIALPRNVSDKQREFSQELTGLGFHREGVLNWDIWRKI